MTLRSCLLAIALAVVPAVGIFATSDAAADTTRPEFHVGKELTAKADVSLPTGEGSAKALVKKGTVAKVSKIMNSGGKPVKLDIKVGDKVWKGIKVSEIRAAFNYVKL